MKQVFTMGMFLLLAAVMNTSAFEFLPTSILTPVKTIHVMSRRSIDITAANGHTKNFQLPEGVSPISYRVQLQPFLEEAHYQGRVNINVTCETVTDTITLHAHETLQVSHSEVKVRRLHLNQTHGHTGLEPLSISSTKKDPSQQWYVIKLVDKLIHGASYEVELAFSGPLVLNRSEAFFLNSYEDHRTKERRWFAATQMRPNNARRLFPCFDGPMYKTTLEISIIRPARMMSLSNMPVQTTEKISDQPGWEIDHFQKSPSMSTFSVAAIVADLGYVTPLNPLTGDGGPRIRLFGRAHFLSRLQDAVDAAPQVVRYFEQMFGTPYPLPKLDLVVLPHYAASYPADLWGVIIFREDDLVGESMQVSLTTEIGYQWLGHLTTPYPRWNEIHINKALINFLTSRRLQNISIAYDWSSTITNDHGLYYEYSRRRPYAMVASMKESIRVMKTQWLFKMLYCTLSGKTFKEGLRRFIRDRQYKVFMEDDLFNSLTQQAWEDQTLPNNYTVEDIAEPWLKYDRYPVVTVTRNYNENSADVEQHVFLKERPHDLANKDKLLWWIPIQYITRHSMDIHNSRPVAWMEKQRHITVKNLPGPESFIIVNPDEIGMFMVNYDLTNWNMVAEFLQEWSPDDAKPLVDMGSRVKLLHDAWNLAYAGELHFGAALNMTLFLRTEKEQPVWEAFFTMVDHVGRHISGTEAGRKFMAYVCQLVGPLYESLPEDKEKNKIAQLSLHRSAKHALCNAGYKPCVDQARAMYARWMEMEDPEEGNPVADSYLCPVFEWGTLEEWEFGLQRLLNFPESREPEERSILLSSLAGCPRDEYRIERILNVSVLEENSNFTDSDLRHIFNVLTSSAQSYTALFNFVSLNWDSIKQRCEGKLGLWEYLIDRAITNFKTQEGLDLVSELYVSRMGQFGTAEPIVEEALRTIKEEAEWSNENLPVIEQWLDAHTDAENVMWY
ncbi:aminopeptidase N [Anabrus simplex]|uniref:aminopeptidase N n=1 Tax=Anabrus simplex TaxID=316456 RepID=UPI0035A3837A